MPHLELPQISDATLVRLIAVVLVVGVVAPIPWSVLVLIFGDRSRSPLDRWATWLAKSWETEDGDPIVKPGTEPSPEQKFGAVAYLLAMSGLIGWLILR